MSAQTLVSIILLLLMFIKSAIMTSSQLYHYLDWDIARLTTVKILTINNTKVIVAIIKPFTLTSKGNVTLYLSPYEVRMFHTYINNLIRYVLSQNVTVILVVGGGPKWLIPKTLERGPSYCWGPSCPLSGNVTITDNPMGSYQFYRYLASSYGSLGLIVSQFLKNHGLLVPRALHEGVYVEGRFAYIGDPLTPSYVYAPTKLRTLLLHALGAAK